MSDISLLSILSGLEGGMSTPVKGEQAKLSLAEVDGELLKSLSPEMKKALEKAEQPVLDFESILKEETPKQASFVQTTAKEIPAEGEKVLAQNSQNAAVKVMKSTQKEGELTQASKVQGEVVESEKSLKINSETTTTPVKNKPQLKIVSGEEFANQKLATQKPVEGAVSEGAKKIAAEEMAVPAKPVAPKMANNPFLSQSNETKGAMALSGALFREAIADVKSEEKESKIEGIEAAKANTLLGTESALKLETKLPVTEASSSSRPVFDISHIDAKKTGDMISQISNYVDRTRLESKGEIDVWVHHKDLGTFQVQATRGGAGAHPVDLKIETFTQEGQQFFNQNAPELVKHLQDSGVKISDFQIKSNIQNSFVSTESGSTNGNNQNQQQSSSQGQAQHQGQGHDARGEGGNDRRRQMWQHYQETFRQRNAS